jgi:teichuronic acid biosynthesis glycosyltransferase TuaC
MRLRNANLAHPTRPRVLVLSKRQYMGRDLIDDRYGRFRELPLALHSLGHEVRGIALSYRSRPEIRLDDGGVRWTALARHRLLPVGRSSYWSQIDAIGAELAPDVIWACSDVPHALLGLATARRLRAKLVIDLYDNFESYPLARVPGVNAALLHAVRHADAVTVVSEPLRRHILDRYRPGGPVTTIENAIPEDLFLPHDRARSRALLGLPEHALVIGTAGAISAGRGIQFLFEAFERIAADRSDAMLVLAGPLDGSLHIPESPRIRYLGMLPAERVPVLLSSLDVAAVCNRDSAFGRFCFPQKLYGALACRVPVAVASIGAMTDLLAADPGNLYTPDDSSSLERTLRRQATERSVPPLPIPTWSDLADRLSETLRAAAA